MSNRSVGENSLVVKRLKGEWPDCYRLTQISTVYNHDEQEKQPEANYKTSEDFFPHSDGWREHYWSFMGRMLPCDWLIWTPASLIIDFYIPKVGTECTDIEMLFKMGFSVSSAQAAPFNEESWRMKNPDKSVSLSHLPCDLDADLVQHLVHNVLRFFLVSRVLEEIVQRVVHWGGEKKPILGSLRFTAAVGFSRIDST